MIAAPMTDEDRKALAEHIARKRLEWAEMDRQRKRENETLRPESHGGEEGSADFGRGAEEVRVAVRGVPLQEAPAVIGRDIGAGTTGEEPLLVHGEGFGFQGAFPISPAEPPVRVSEGPQEGQSERNARPGRDGVEQDACMPYEATDDDLPEFLR